MTAKERRQFAKRYPDLVAIMKLIYEMTDSLQRFKRAAHSKNIEYYDHEYYFDFQILAGIYKFNMTKLKTWKFGANPYIMEAVYIGSNETNLSKNLMLFPFETSNIINDHIVAIFRETYENLRNEITEKDEQDIKLIEDFIRLAKHKNHEQVIKLWTELRATLILIDE